jgi:ComF family protein
VNTALFNKVVHPLRRGLHDLAGLLLPRRCAGCDDVLRATEQAICLVCLEDLPRTRFTDATDNPVARIFWGRVELAGAMALLHFDKRGLAQRLLHRLKYKGDKAVGRELGRLLGNELRAAQGMPTVDVVLPVPLHPRKERERGYNQSALIAEGVREALGLADHGPLLERVVHTASQTRKGRAERWVNVKEAFRVRDQALLRDRHVLLVDDVVTTGATLESCVRALQQLPGTRVSVATVAFA